MSWMSVGFFTGMGFHVLAGDGSGAAGRVLVGVIGGVLGGLTLGYAASLYVSDSGVFTALMPALIGAALALYVYKLVFFTSR